MPKSLTISAHAILIVLGLFIGAIGMSNLFMLDSMERKIVEIEQWPRLPAKITHQPFYGSFGSYAKGGKHYASPVAYYWFEYQGKRYTGSSRVGKITDDANEAEAEIAALGLERDDNIQVWVNPDNLRQSYFNPRYMISPDSHRYHYAFIASVLMIIAGLVQWLRRR